MGFVRVGGARPLEASAKLKLAGLGNKIVSSQAWVTIYRRPLFCRFHIHEWFEWAMWEKTSHRVAPVRHNGRSFLFRVGPTRLPVRLKPGFELNHSLEQALNVAPSTPTCL